MAEGEPLAVYICNAINEDVHGMEELPTRGVPVAVYLHDTIRLRPRGVSIESSFAATTCARRQGSSPWACLR